MILLSTLQDGKAKQKMDEYWIAARYAGIDGIMKIYTQSKKQVFIAFDKQAAYMPDTQRVLADNTVLKLSDDNCELYGESWNKEVSQNENEL